MLSVFCVLTLSYIAVSPVSCLHSFAQTSDTLCKLGQRDTVTAYHGAHTLSQLSAYMHVHICVCMLCACVHVEEHASDPGPTHKAI